MIGTENVRNFVRERAMRARMGAYRMLGDDHTTAYRKLMAHRIRAHGPDHAVGHHESDLGTWQFWWLVHQAGLRADDRVLDLGCGTGRLSRYLVPYLDAGGYTGLDISPEALDVARQRIHDDVRRDRRPTLCRNEDLRLEEVDGEVDLVWANSLLTHLQKRKVVEVLEHLPEVLAEDGQAFLTFFDETQQSAKDFGYTPAEIQEIASNVGIHLTIYPTDAVDHPHGQRLLSVRRHSDVPDRFNSSSPKAGRDVAEMEVVQ